MTIFIMAKLSKEKKQRGRVKDKVKETVGRDKENIEANSKKSFALMPRVWIHIL
jgi:hypothetical protein